MKKAFLITSVLAVLGWFALVLLLNLESGERTIHFMEDVQLASGQLVEAERTLEVRPLGEPGGPGGYRILKNTFAVTAKPGAPPLPPWVSTSGLTPLLFDQEPGTGEWLLVATFFTCDAWYELGRPALPYAEFRLRQGVWTKVPLSAGLIGRPANVLIGISRKAEPARHTPATRLKRDGSSTVAPKYKTIVGSWSTSC